MTASDFEHYDDEQLIDALKKLLEDKFEMEEEALQAGLEHDEINELIELGKRIGSLENELSHRGYE